MNNGEYETLAYENMAMQYFHLNDSTRATYYHQRADHGILEPKNSTQRHMALEIRRQEKMLLGIKKKKVRQRIDVHVFTNSEQKQKRSIILDVFALKEIVAELKRRGNNVATNVNELVEEICNHKMPSVGTRKAAIHQGANKKDNPAEDRVTFVEEKMLRQSTPIDKIRRNNLPSPA